MKYKHFLQMSLLSELHQQISMSITVAECLELVLEYLKKQTNNNNNVSEMTVENNPP